MTRVAAAANAIVVLGAVGVHLFGESADGLSGMFTTNVEFQLTFFVFFSLLLLVWRGSGPFSLDRILGREPAPDPSMAPDMGA